MGWRPQILVACALAACHSFHPTSDPAGDAGSATDGASAAARTVRCPSSPVQRCAIGVTLCCATSTPGNVPLQYACGDPGQCSGNDQLRIPCGSADDCAAGGFPGAVCCMFRNPSGEMDRFECVAPVACPAQGHVCDPLAPECGADCTPDPQDYYPELYFCAK